VILCGPELPQAQRRNIQERVAQRSDVYLEEFTDDIMSYFEAADLIVSMGGYNTVCEILSLRKRSIVVPRVKPVLEQLIRAERMQARGLLNCIHPDDLSPALLMQEVMSELSRSNVYPHALQQIDMNALPRINAILEDLLFDTSSFKCAAGAW
jgi:predicted glycosyltransferase